MYVEHTKEGFNLMGISSNVMGEVLRALKFYAGRGQTRPAEAATATRLAEMIEKEQEVIAQNTVE